MTRVYKSARGKMIDMDKIKLTNETATSVGNMRVNARGDLIGAGGQVAQGRNALMDKVYSVPSAPSPMYSPGSPEVLAEQQAMVEASKAKELHDLANTLTVPTTTEPTVDNATDPTTPSRGSLASSLAKKVSVTQEPLVDPRKPKGPSRI
jgi:hypothetical protein